MGSGCNTVGKVVASDPSDRQFDSSHCKCLFSVNCFEENNNTGKL